MKKVFNTATGMHHCISYRRLFLIFVLIGFGFSVKAEPVTTKIVVVTHPQTKLEQISQEQIRKRWLSMTTRIDRQRVDIIDFDENSPLRTQFYSQIIGVSDNQLKAYWAKKVFRGEGLPPEMKSSSAEILQWVNKQPNRIGYLYKKDINNGVKILFEMN